MKNALGFVVALTMLIVAGWAGWAVAEVLSRADALYSGNVPDGQGIVSIKLACAAVILLMPVYFERAGRRKAGI